MSLNVVVTEGTLGRDPELKNTGSGTAVCNFSLAVDRPYKNGEEKVTDWFNYVAWRQTAEWIAKWFHKGDSMAVRGRLQSREYTDKEGVKRKTVEIMVEEASFVTGSKKNDGTSSVGSAKKPSGLGSSNVGGKPAFAPPDFADLDDDGTGLPF